MAIYLDYDQAGLDAQYNLRNKVPEHPEFFRIWRETSEAARKRGPVRLDLAYDAGASKEALDFFPAARPDAPCLHFIHGGYWQGLDKSDFSYVAPIFQAAGIAVSVVNYTLAPKVGMDEIVRQNRAAIAWLAGNAGELGIDNRRIHVAGHSAGGHLTAMMLLTDWAKLGLRHNPVAGGCGISGLYDLEPIRLCYLNKVIGMDAETARRNSPIRHLPKSAPPLILGLGTAETPEFHRQQASFAAVWGAAGLPLSLADQEGDHHFSVALRLGEAKSPLHRAVMQQISG